MDAKDQTQVITFSGKHLYLLRCLPVPSLVFFVCLCWFGFGFIFFLKILFKWLPSYTIVLSVYSPSCLFEINVLNQHWITLRRAQGDVQCSTRFPWMSIGIHSYLKPSVTISVLGHGWVCWVKKELTVLNRLFFPSRLCPYVGWSELFSMKLTTSFPRCCGWLSISQAQGWI